MSRGWIDLAVTLALLGALLTAATTGVLAEALGVERSIYHRTVAYSLFILGCLHVALRRGQLASRLRRALAPPRTSDGTAQARPLLPTAARVPFLSRRSLLLAAAAAAVGFAARPWLLPYRPASGLDERDLGELYHQWSKPSFAGVLTKPLSWGTRPPLYRDYPGSTYVALPEIGAQRGLAVEDAIERRRSIRDYSGSPLSLEQLSRLLHAASGITDSRQSLRASPSAGAQYPIEIYPVVHDVRGLAPGVYHYRPQDHALDMLKDGNFRLAALAASGGQDQAGTASVVFVLAAVFQRTRWRYKDRAYRYVLLDAGHLGENVYLQATSLGIGVCGMGAFLDDDVNALVNIDGKNEAAVYLLALGGLA